MGGCNCTRDGIETPRSTCSYSIGGPRVLRVEFGTPSGLPGSRTTMDAGVDPCNFSKIEEILENPEIFHAFKAHLEKESSDENLNFLVDTIMYQRLVKRHRARRRKELKKIKKASALLGEAVETLGSGLRWPSGAHGKLGRRVERRNFARFRNMKSDPTTPFAKRDSLSENYLPTIDQNLALETENMWANLEIVDDDEEEEEEEEILESEVPGNELLSARSLPHELMNSVRTTLQDLRLNNAHSDVTTVLKKSIYDAKREARSRDSFEHEEDKKARKRHSLQPKQSTPQAEQIPWRLTHSAGSRRVVRAAMTHLGSEGSYGNPHKKAVLTSETESDAVVFNGLSWMPTLFEQEDNNLENIAREIYTTYCMRGAPQEINAGDQQRLTALFSQDRLDERELYHVFDKAFNIVVQLLTNDSLMRFRQKRASTPHAPSGPVRRIRATIA